MKRIIIIAIITILGFALPAFATIINIPADYPTIQTGINASSDGDTVLVQPGTYVENINFNGHNIVLGSLFLTTGDTTYIAETVIDGGDIAPAINIEDIESHGTQIVGFKVQNGNYLGGVHCGNSSLAIFSCLIVDNHVGGIFCENSSLLVYSCTIAGNHSFFTGGGIKLINSDVSIQNCNIIANTVAPYGYDGPSLGGGIYCSNSNAVLVHNNISNNFGWARPMFHDGGDGTGFYCDSSDVILVNNAIKDNTSGGGAGVGIFCRYSDIIIRNNIITGNYSYYGQVGGGIACVYSNSTIINNTIMANEILYSGGGISCFGGNTTVVNNIVRGNLPNQIRDSCPSVSYSNIQDGWEGEGNIDIDPLFRDPENGDFHLMSTECGDPHDSPCIDTGSPAIIDSLLSCDWGLGTILSDMGAYGGGDSVMVDIDDYVADLPDKFSLLQNYPNPFNPTTIIRYSLPAQSDVRIEIYNILGQQVATLFDGNKQAGYHTITWQADDYPSGVYFARLETGTRSESIKMVLLK